MRMKEMKQLSVEQLRATKTSLGSELLRHVATVAGNSSEARQRRAIRKDLARVSTLLRQK